MKNTVFVVLLIILALAGVAVYNSAIIVHQTQYALIIRLGEWKRTISEPGLHWIVPVVDSVEYVENRILDFEIPSIELTVKGKFNSGVTAPAANATTETGNPTPPVQGNGEEAPGQDREAFRLVVNAFARYKITDPLVFSRKVKNESQAAVNLEQSLRSAVRNVLGTATFVDTVKERREELMGKIAERINEEAKGYGIKIIDVRIKRADVPQENRPAIFSRMQAERKAEAAKYRALGNKESLGIRARADAEATVIEANALRDSEQIRGDGDAERNRVYAEAFGKDPDFFAFYRSMQAYEEGLKSGSTQFVISPDSEFFRYFGSSTGAARVQK
jgi:modulator of FtsH protease HflC